MLFFICKLIFLTSMQDIKHSKKTQDLRRTSGSQKTSRALNNEKKLMTVSHNTNIKTVLFIDFVRVPLQTGSLE